MRLELPKNRAVQIADEYTARKIFNRNGEKDNLDSYSIGDGVEHTIEKKAGYLFNTSKTKAANLEACVITAAQDYLYEVYDKELPKDPEILVEYTFVLLMMVINGTRFGKRYAIDFEQIIDNWLIAREEAKKK